jgi:PAS domain S-box-containing protein
MSMKPKAEKTRRKRERSVSGPAASSEQRLHAFVRASADVVYSMSPDWGEMRELHGKDFIPDIPTPCSDWLERYIHPDDRAHVKGAVDQAIRTGSIFELEHRVIRADGSPGWAHSRAVPLSGGDGKIIEWFGITRDVTERRRNEEAIWQSEARSHAIISQTTVGVAQTDLTGRYTMVNDRFCAMTGYTREELLVLCAKDITHPDDRPGSLEKFQQMLATGEDYTIEKRYLRKDGVIVWANNNVTLLRDVAGVPLYTLGVVLDITEQKRTEHALRESEARFRNMADHAPGMVWVTGPDARCTFVSSSWYEFTGQTPETALGFGWAGAVHPEDIDKISDTFIAANAKQETFRLEYRLRRKDGDYCWVIAAATPRLGGNGEFLGYIGSVMDISERKQLEEKTRRLAQRLQLVTDAMPALISYIDKTCNYRFVNKAYQEWFGYKTEEILGKSMQEVLGKAAYKRLRPHVEAALAGERVHFEEQIAYKKGGGRSILGEYVPDIRPDGSVAGFYVLIQDISVRKQLEEETRHLAQRLQLITDSLPALISYIDADLRYRFNNKTYYEWFGYKPDEIDGKTVPEVIGATAYARVRPHIEAALAGRRVHFEEEIDYKKVGTRNIIAEYVPDIRPDGSVAGFYGLISDITDRKRAEKALEHHAEEIESLLKAAPLGVYLVDADFKIRTLNPVAQPVFGDIPGGVIGRDHGEIMHLQWEQEYADELVRIFRHTLETGEPYVTKERAEYRIDRKTMEYYEWRLDRLTLPDGRYGVVCYFRDISEQVQVRKEIERSRDTLRESDRRKDEFLATLSHELRNPLAPIRQAAKLLKTPGISERDAQWARDVIDRQVRAMGWLLDDLLDLSRISSGKLELRKEQVVVSDVVESALELARPLIEAKHHKLHVELPAAPERLVADPLRLAQIISNLLTNAAKYTDPSGEIRLRAEREAEELVVRVSDNGIGISADMLPRVFDMFSQAVPALARTEGGLGVGLALVRGFISLHGGTVVAHSDGPGKGSEFTVRLPLGIAPVTRPETRPSMPDTGRSRGLKILVVDDNRDTAETLAALIKLEGCDVRATFDGRDALETAEAFHPDVALLDIGMPQLNGYEIARLIRERSWGEDMTLIAVTGWGQEEDQRRAIAAGFDYHLRKPIDPEFLKTLLNQPPALQGNSDAAPLFAIGTDP